MGLLRVVYLEPLLHDFPQLLRQLITRVLNFDIAPLGHDFLRCERSPRISPSRITPPLLGFLDFLLELLLLGVNICHGVL